MDKISLREATAEDVQKQLDYFKNSPPEFLRAIGINPAVVTRFPAIDVAKFNANLQLPFEQRASYSLAVQVDGDTKGIIILIVHEFGKLGEVHGHLYSIGDRHQGYGTSVLREAVGCFFELFKLEVLFCTPSASNKAVNGLLQKLGLTVKDSYVIPAHDHLVERLVNRYEITRAFLD